MTPPGGTTDAQRFAFQRCHHRRRARFRGGGQAALVLRGTQRQDRAQHPVGVGGHGPGDLAGQAGEVVGGVIGCVVAPVPAGPPDGEADSLQRRRS